jgi:hypothetical protein
MLYGTGSFGLEEYLLVFVHIPKTGGVSLWESMRDCWGVEAVRWLAPENFEKIGRSRLHTLHRQLRYRLDRLNMRRRGKLAGQPQYLPEHEKQAIKCIRGHVRLGQEPDLGKKPLYISVLRDPVDRFVSEYYFYLGKVKRDGKKRFSDPIKNAINSLDFDQYVDFVSELPPEKTRNLQCQYLASSPRFEAARQVVDEVVYLCAPLERMDDFNQLLSMEFGLRNEKIERQNISHLRPERVELRDDTRVKIMRMFDQDMRLYQYVQEQFDGIYRRYVQQAG